jgi:predicted Fe-Mo cluster-binding NifX family protein
LFRTKTIISRKEEAAMKILITATGDNLDAGVDPRFGRCAFFLLVDSETGDLLQAERNEAAAAAGGAGIQSAQWVVRQGAKAVLTGNIGPNAFDVLAAGKINVYAGVSGSVREALERLKRGELKPIAQSTAARHLGMQR